MKVEPLDATGDAALWITSRGYQNLAIARPANSRTASLDFDFKAGIDETRIVIRNESMKPARFRVSLGTAERPVDTDPDEGDAVGGAAPADLVGKHCEGVARARAQWQTFDDRGDLVESDGNWGDDKPAQTFVVGVDFDSATKIRVTTHATNGAPRALHAVATVNDPNAISSSPTQIVWNVPVKRSAGQLLGSTTMGNAKATAAVGANQVFLSFAGKISAPWNGNTMKLESSVDATVLLETCTTTP